MSSIYRSVRLKYRGDDVVYMIQSCIEETVKIGITSRAGLKNRFRQIELHIFCCPCRLLRVINGSLDAEKWLHNRFIKYHLYREIFQFTDEMLTVILPEDLTIRYYPSLGTPHSARQWVQPRRVGLDYALLERLFDNGIDTKPR